MLEFKTWSHRAMPQDLLAMLVPTLVILAPVAYLALSNREKLPGLPSKHGPADSSTTNQSAFDTSNLRVSKILVHPIKSCKGTSVQEAKYTLEGLENDRKWCIVRQDDHVVVTARQVSKLVLIHPRIIAESLVPHGGRLQVAFPENSGCEPFDVALRPSEETFQTWKSIDVELWGKKDVQGFICESVTGRSPSAILSDYIGFPVHLVVKGPRVRTCPPTARFPKLDAPSYFQDGYPLLLVSEESVGAVQAQIRGMVGSQGVDDRWAEESLEVERFRPNIVFKGAGAPFLEDVVTELCITPDEAASDGAIVRLVSKCTRCLLPNVDPATGIRDESVPFKAMMKFRRGLDPSRAGSPCLGCNGVPTGAGVVRVGDGVRVVKMGIV